VGRLLLHLHNKATDNNLELSDQICTALQLINFLQDIQQDTLESKRLYIPHEDISSINLCSNSLIEHIKLGAEFNKNESLLFKQQIIQAEKLLIAGQPLINHLSGRFKFEISMIVQSGLRVIYKLKQSKKFSDRPRLNKWDKLTILYNVAFS